MDNKNEEVKKKAKELKLLIEKYNKALEEVRDKCSHKNVKIKMIHNEYGTTTGLRKVCEDCDKIIGYPTSSESDEYYNNIS